MEAAEEPGCLKHPAYLAVGTCVRCGQFICDQCVEDASLADLPESGKCPECELREPPPRSFGGLLWLAGVQVLFGVPVSTLKSLAASFEKFSGAHDSAYLPPVIVRIVFETIVIILCAFTGRAFLKRQKRAVPLMKAFYATWLVSAFVGFGTSRWLWSIAGEPAPELELAGWLDLVIPPLLSVLWFAYFTFSKRVKQTFVVP